MGPKPPRPLWICPICGQSFVTPRMWHSCVRRTVEDFFRGNEDKRPLYDAFLAFVRRFGAVTVNVTKTRIAFQGRVRFAGVAGIRRDWLLCGFWLKRRIDSPRFTRVEALPRNDYVYHFRLRSKAELDDELAGWIEEAAKVGWQLHARAGSGNRRPRQRLTGSTGDPMLGRCSPSWPSPLSWSS